MQLKNIKVAGFKSFADPTVIPFQSRLTAIVGPNGCGKSNIIDAVRCVLSGAARQLRGESMPDIIFNGSTKRKPVGQASVEMIFDNADGSLGGEYAQYAEISVRREINRDGTSDYFLNGVRCRRRDVVDIFLGTGLGPQSYAIIEQGMISRIIEAKPEDLRAHLEEAAGISKYKERRRETENRMQHTRENLTRLEDHRLELDKQLAHLKRQANAAERYKELNQEVRLTKAQLQALLWQELKQQLADQEAQLQSQETQLESNIAQLRQADAAIEKLRVQKSEHGEIFNEVQSRYYSLGATIAGLEQQLKNGRERQQQLQTDLAQAEANYQEIQQNYDQDQEHAEELSSEVLQLEPGIEAAQTTAEQSQQQLINAEQTMQEWQHRWDDFNQQAASVVRQLEVEKTRGHHLEQTVQNAQQRIARLEEEQQQFNFSGIEAEITQHATQAAVLQQQLEELQMANNFLLEQLNQQRNDHTQLASELAQARNQLQSVRGRHASLEALQQAALGKNDNAVTNWLLQQQLQQKARLAENLEVEPGWELAVETVLGPYLEAVCVDDFTQLANSLSDFNAGNLSLFKMTNAAQVQNNPNMPALLNKIKCAWSVNELLTGIYVAEDILQAMNLSANLAPHESIITRDGIWMGSNWVRIAKTADVKVGVIQRERELHELNHAITNLQQLINDKEQAYQLAQQRVSQLETDREQAQQQLRETSAALSEIQAQLTARNARLEQLRQRQATIARELAETEQQLAQNTAAFEAAQQAYQQANQKIEQHTLQKEQLLQQRDQYRQQLELQRQQARADKLAADEMQVRLESSRSQLHYIRQTMGRAEKQLVDLTQRREHITKTLAEIVAPMAAWQQELEQLLSQRLQNERELEQARQKLNEIEHELQQQEKLRAHLSDLIEKQRHGLEQLRMQLQALQIHQTGHQEKIIELGYELAQTIAELPPEAVKSQWEERVAQLEAKIQRLGAINLAAIDEYQQLSERKTYLDAQHNDLMEALNTLDEAIRKIDRESRTRLQETFDKVNANFNALFQRVFNGGQAHLELLGDDLLATGIAVKAQPPGKRNTSIHLLSGGEKALTASALVFALFQLNPAPFCILDEVDAPLDDLNVGRFCTLVKEMSQHVQFIFISHNKLSIEIADQLIGVTMNEPGVSRLVAVDIEAAIEMAKA